MSVDKDMVALVRAIGDAVKELPAAVQQAAFQFLLENHLGERARGAVPVEVTPSAAQVSPDWTLRLANSVGVTPEQVQSMVAMDENGRIHVIRPDLGDKEAHRNRNITLIALWAARVLNRDIYCPAAEIRRMVKDLRLTPRNFESNVKRDRNIKSLNLHGQKMLQLVGSWEERVAGIFREHAS